MDYCIVYFISPCICYQHKFNTRKYLALFLIYNSDYIHFALEITTKQIVIFNFQQVITKNGFLTLQEYNKCYILVHLSTLISTLKLLFVN